MEKVKDAAVSVEVFENDLLMYLSMFCEENQIEDMKRESQAVWNSCLRYIYKHVFRGTDILKTKVNVNGNNNIMPSTFNAYNYDLVLSVLDIYIYDMCMKYDKEVSIIGFSTLTGIDESVIYDWSNGNSGTLSTQSSKIYEKLRNFREESLSNKLVTGKQNPVGVLGVLNRHYQWNMPGVKEQGTKKQLSLTDLQGMKLSENGAQSGGLLPENGV
jgi:hypothetical protein